MTRPRILVCPGLHEKGAEFNDDSVTLSHRYTEAIFAAGGLPVIMPFTTDARRIREIVLSTHGVMLTGGDDVAPELYLKNAPAGLAARVGKVYPERDLMELALIAEILRRGRPLLAICRGLQILNVAMGGTLIVDIPSQVPNAIPHNPPGRRNEPVHEVHLTDGSGMARVMKGMNIRVNSSHHQAADRIGDGLQVTGRSPDGIAECLEFSGIDYPFMLAVQFHPERLFDRHSEFLRLFRALVAACGLPK